MSGDVAGSSSICERSAALVSLAPEPYVQSGDGVRVLVMGSLGWNGGRAASVVLKSSDRSRTNGLAAGGFVLEACGRGGG